jgi:inosose dehydratase
MQELGLAATEVGSDGYLPTDPAELRDLCQEFDLEMIGGFVPIVIHDTSEEQATIEAVHRAAALMSAAGGTVFVSCAVTSWDWQPRTQLGSSAWRQAARMLSMIDEIVEGYGMTQALHSHLGTIVETRDEVLRVLEMCGVGFTLDTGHLQVGGMDPLTFVDEVFDRIQHVHLKDVIMDLAAPVAAGEQSILQGVQSGMFCNLGRGDVAIREIVRRLEDRGYDHWYVLEQDAALTSGQPAVGRGPILDVRESIEFLRGIETTVSAA